MVLRGAKRRSNLCNRFGRLCLTLGLLVLLAIPTHISARTWNPFESAPDRPSFFDQIRDNLRGVVRNVEDFVGRIVSRFRLADSARLGFRPSSAYKPPTGSPRISYPPAGFRSKGIPPTPIVDIPKLGKPGGGNPGDPFWAEDCSCVASTGAATGIQYQVSNRCPENPDLPCEACRKITRHDNQIRSILKCREQDFGESTAVGGKPSADLHGL